MKGQNKAIPLPVSVHDFGDGIKKGEVAGKEVKIAMHHDPASLRSIIPTNQCELSKNKATLVMIMINGRFDPGIVGVAVVVRVPRTKNE